MKRRGGGRSSDEEERRMMMTRKEFVPLPPPMSHLLSPHPLPPALCSRGSKNAANWICSLPPPPKFLLYLLPPPVSAAVSSTVSVFARVLCSLLPPPHFFSFFSSLYLNLKLRSFVFSPFTLFVPSIYFHPSNFVSNFLILVPPSSFSSSSILLTIHSTFFYLFPFSFRLSNIPPLHI